MLVGWQQCNQQRNGLFDVFTLFFYNFLSVQVFRGKYLHISLKQLVLKVKCRLNIQCNLVLLPCFFFNFKVSFSESYRYHPNIPEKFYEREESWCLPLSPSPFAFSPSIFFLYNNIHIFGVAATICDEDYKSHMKKFAER